MSKPSRNANALRYALAHHASELQEIVDVITFGYAIELEPLGWKLRPSLSGANSYSLRKGNKQYHLRAELPKRIQVKDRYQNGAVVATITGRVDAFRFIERLVSES